MDNITRSLLESVRDGSVSVDEAMLKLKASPFEDLGFAKVDLHRRLRQGAAEVVYGAGKTPAQIAEIIGSLKNNGEPRVLVTRLSPEAAEKVNALSPIEYFPEARIGLAGGFPEPDGIGCVVVATGGTSDIPVAEEAALFCRERGIKQITVDVDPFAIEGFAENPPERCYICKRKMFEAMLVAAREAGVDHIAEGSNADDAGDYRPGMRAVRELGVMSPLLDAGLTKSGNKSSASRNGARGFGKALVRMPCHALSPRRAHHT